MKRIVAALKNKVESLKLDRKISRVYRSIDTAKDNAEDTIDKLKEEMCDLLGELEKTSEVNGIITKISYKIGNIEEQKEIIERLNKVKEFIEEDVEVEKD